jgi:hypothetical protein
MAAPAVTRDPLGRRSSQAIVSDEAMGKENAMAVISAVTPDKRQHGKDSS